jgi:hypothetical protein
MTDMTSQKTHKGDLGEESETLKTEVNMFVCNASQSQGIRLRKT